MQHFKTLRAGLLFTIGIGFGACAPEVEIDSTETVEALGTLDGPTVEFNPALKVLPFPDNLGLLSNGNLELPAQCNESATAAAMRTRVLNQLDGFGAFKSPIQVTFTAPVDMASIEGNVKFVKRADINGPLATPVEIPFVAFSSTKYRYANCDTAPSAIDALTLVPALPLDESSTYAVVLLEGISTMSGQKFLPSSTWGLVRQNSNPVTLSSKGEIISQKTPLDPLDPAGRASLLGIDMLWKFHAPLLTLVDSLWNKPRNEILLAWEFTTQTLKAPLDKNVAQSPASAIVPAPIAPLGSILGEASVAQFIEGALASPGVCAQLGCDAVGDIVAGAFLSPRYQQPIANPLGENAKPIPGMWDSPSTPSQQATSSDLVPGNETISMLAFIPASPAPETGYPTVMFGHGITRSKGDVLAIGSQLARAGIMTVAFDWVKHGARAVAISDNPAMGCSNPQAENPNQTQCFAQMFSSDLGSTRDSFRQSALDGLALIEALKACDATGPANCGAIKVDTDSIGYIGQSLGAIIGSLIVSMSPDIKAAVLNVGGASFVDIIEYTDTTALRCPLFDTLIDAGIIEGDKWNPFAHTGICEDDPSAWQVQPGYQVFAATSRWILDPADGVHFATGLHERPVLLQEVIGDLVVPNVATELFGKLLSPAPVGTSNARAADVWLPTSAIPHPSAALFKGPALATPAWLTYVNVPADAESGFPGNFYHHGSLLAPATGVGGSLGTGQMQTDAITYLAATLLH